MTRHLIQLSDIGNGQDLERVLDMADGFKDRRGGTRELAGKAVALVFQKASTRTRISLEVAVYELGGFPVVVTSTGSQLGRGEPIRDTARVLGRMVHAITFRTFSEENLFEMAEHSGVPVLNALTDRGHPMQLLADLMTIRRARGKLKGLRYAWIGDGNNMANSWIEAAGLLGLDLVIGCPVGFDPDGEYLETARQRGGQIEIVRDPKEAARGADVVSTDVFTSMGQEAEQTARLEAFNGYTVTRELLSASAKDVMVLHCLPAHRGEEIEDAVLEGPNSHVWDQAEARLHTAKAALAWALADGSGSH